MLKILALLIGLILSTTAKANVISQDFGYKFCNHHEFTYFVFKVYDVYLCVNDRDYLYPKKIYETNFSLIASYNMDFSKNQLAESSIKEMNRYYDLSEEDQKIYYEQLISIYPDIEKGDIIQTKYNQKGTLFFYNSSLIGKISDAKFSRIFLDIWLYQDNKYKDMTEDLFLKK